MENQRMTPAPDNHLVKAILTMLFCCLPFGIVSLVYATKVEGLWAQGEKELAHKAANDANKWANIGIGCGIAWVIIYSIILFASAYLGLGFGFLFM